MTEEVVLFVVAGFLAQLVDGALGMAYGVTCTSLLLASGFTPAMASASVHTAEIVTSGFSGHFHWRLGNVDKQLFHSLVWPGSVGGALGAFVLTSVPAEGITPWVSIYLALMGGRMVLRAVRSTPRRAGRSHTGLLGFAGGFMDAIGGGGWGPIVASTLMGRGEEPRVAIGSVNRAEFFVTVVQCATFVAAIGLGHWKIIAALSVGGALAAPLSALVARHVPARFLMIGVGIVITLLSLRTLLVYPPDLFGAR